ncbi:unnamed protein product [Pelagomonas calceolata]|uniref:Uncharacterized protein n=1 Tax=Pelagomonas calceolata TaxID=35677 RepID=A0A8J2SMJ3_9STRA|nr:unnamed protein product [Pelagomonas calceolata]
MTSRWTRRRRHGSALASVAWRWTPLLPEVVVVVGIRVHDLARELHFPRLVLLARLLEHIDDDLVAQLLLDLAAHGHLDQFHLERLDLVALDELDASESIQSFRRQDLFEHRGLLALLLLLGGLLVRVLREALESSQVAGTCGAHAGR